MVASPVPPAVDGAAAGVLEGAAGEVVGALPGPGTRGAAGPPPRRARVAGTALPLVLGALVLSGCTYTTPQDTRRSMIPGDGQNFTLSDGVSVSSLLIVSTGEGEPGALVARVVNAGEEAASVTITGAGVDEDVRVPGGQTAAIGGVDADAGQVRIDSVPGAPGRMVPMTFALDGGEERVIGTPVLDGSFERYEPYLEGLEQG